MFDCGPTGWCFESCLVPDHLTFRPVVQGVGMSIRGCATGHIKDPLPLVKKSRASCTGARFPPSFIYQEIITGLNSL